MQEVDKGALFGRTCFDLLENALLTRITDLLSAHDLVHFASSCKSFAGLEKESSDLKHAQLCAHFTAAGAADTVAWLTSNREQVFSTFIVVTGAPYSALERLVEAPEAPERPPLLFPNSELFAALEPWSDASQATRRPYMLPWLTQELCMLPHSSAEIVLIKQEKLPKRNSRSSWIDIDLVNYAFT